jgi:predicted nuclease with TOPRIM domain
MENLSTKVNDISSKIEKLIHLQAELKKENSRLKEDNELLSRDIELHKNKLKELENRNKIVKLAKTLSDVESESTTDAKSKVSELIREVDKCIALLNR